MSKNTKMDIKSIWKSVCSFGRDFCMLSTMHGLNHIAERDRHWSERWLWALVFMASVAGAVHVSLGQWQRYNENPTVVTLEKDFRSWRFSYPAVTTCDVNRTDLSKLRQVIKNYWDVSPGEDKYEYYTRFVQTVTSSNLYSLSGFLEFRDDNTLNVNLYQLAVEVSPPLQIKTTWSETEHASTKWYPVMTEAGVCYVINSLAVYDQALVKPNANETLTLPKTCKSLTCNIMMEFTLTADFFAHSAYDVADVSSPIWRGFRTVNRVIELSVLETKAGEGVKELRANRRGCLYTDEPQESVQQVYSTQSCRRSCRNRLAIELCGCKPFYNFYEEGVPCSARGMACLAPYADRLANINGIHCACLPQCIDSVFSELSTDDIVWEKGPFMQRGSIKLVVQGQRIRYTREIVFHFQDLVVSFGGATGLFLGASFISFVEILYFVLDRLFKVFGKDRHPVDVVQVKEAKICYEAEEIIKLDNLINVSTKYNSIIPM